MKVLHGGASFEGPGTPPHPMQGCYQRLATNCAVCAPSSNPTQWPVTSGPFAMGDPVILWPFATCEIAMKLSSFCPAAIVMIPNEFRQDPQVRAVYDRSLMYDDMPSLVSSSDIDYDAINEALGEGGSA